MWTHTRMAAFAASFILLLSSNLEAANILAVFGTGSRSHNNIYVAVTTALAERGHKLTVYTPLPINPTPPNYKQIDTSEITSTHFSAFTATGKLPISELFKNFSNLAWDNCEKTFNLPQVKLLLDTKREGNNFDLLLTSTVLTECFYAFAHIYKIPIVLISPNGPMLVSTMATGNVVLSSFVPHMLLNYSDHMTFYERIVNSLFYWGTAYYYHLSSTRDMNTVMKNVFGEQMPTVNELEKNVSLVLVNTHFSFNYPQPLSPIIVEVGGIHIKPPKALPNDLQAFMDSASKEGVIYFSLGSILKSSGLENKTRDEFVSAFSKLKQKVLWKWEGDIPIPGQTNNIRAEKWLPQQDILAHPSVKLFITHGGLLSLQEATTRGVPVIGIPFYGDQESNMKRITDLNAGVTLDIDTLTSDSILNAIQTILGDPKYAANMKNLQAIVTDRPKTPTETAMYWIEYVIRHKGAKHMKPASSELHWAQVFLLDVTFVVFVIPALTVFALAYVIIKKCLCKKNTSSQNSKSSPKKTQ